MAPPSDPRLSTRPPAALHWRAPGGARTIPAVPDTRGAAALRRLADWVALTKPRVIAMATAATAVGFHLASPGLPNLSLLLGTLLGTAFAAGGTLALNQVMERDRDARMQRTRGRPLPDGRLAPREAFAVGSGLLGGGFGLLWLAADPRAALVTAAIALVYLLVYTPLKPLTPLCSAAGAVAGALPPVAGWAAARGALGAEPWVLFAIVFLWQIPHSLAIARVHREDYARAGFRLLPVVDRDGPRTGGHVVASALLLVPIALVPTVVGLAGHVYLVVALALGLHLLRAAVGLARTRSAAAARRVLRASLVHLPLLLGVMAFDKAW